MAESAKLRGNPYGIQDWGASYFDVSPSGEVQVRLIHRGHPRLVSLLDMVTDLEARGVQPPYILRFRDILDSRLTLLNKIFREQINNLRYQGEYRGVFPIKVNQQQQVVEEVVTCGAKFHHGLEVGSKAELIAALTYMDDPQPLIICNGYKDEQFVDLALFGRKIGLRVLLIVEMPAEIDLIVRRSRALRVAPEIGVRVKLATRGSGRWLESGGDRSVFGLNAGEILYLLDRLREEGLLHRLVMLHFHLGSQIPNIQTIRTSVEEAARLYAGLVQEGAHMGYLDIGGGLAVDYEGTQTDSDGSCNYDLPEYCSDIIEVVKNTLDETGTIHPTIVSESGRFIVAHYAVLIFNILGVAEFCHDDRPEKIPPDYHEYTHYLLELHDILTIKNLQECMNDAVFYRDQIRSMFNHGKISLRERGVAERLFNGLVNRISLTIRELDYVPEGLRKLKNCQADAYYGNFSLFQSLPDAWAINQLFPVMPIHRLNEAPERVGVIADITCDCDGKIDRFVDAVGPKQTLPLHRFKSGEPYYLGVFLIGAYQETLGDLHNLFGDPNVISIRIDEDGALEYSREVEGDTVADVLSYVEFDPKAMRTRFRDFVEQAVRRDLISATERRLLLEAYDQGMRSYTYIGRM